MKRRRMHSTLRKYGFLILSLSLGFLKAQEEGSADLFTDAYTDQFQEAFFEALKQKGIENYDRAEALLLDAKKLDPLSPVVDHELARVLLLSKAYERAERYALDAVRARPGEYWYVQTLMEILNRQSKTPEMYKGELPLEMEAFRLNLARWYFSAGKFEKAREQLDPLPETEAVRQLRARIESLGSKKESGQPEAPVVSGVVEEGSVAFYEAELRGLVRAEDWNQVQQMSREALERYPLQPYFYYTSGIALLRQGKALEASSILQEGEGMLLGDSEVAQDIYRALAEAYTVLGNPAKAKKYQDKLKSGS